MIYISMADVANYSYELVVGSDLEVIEMSEVGNGAKGTSRNDQFLAFEWVHIMECF